METISTDDAGTALRMLADAAAERDAQLSAYEAGGYAFHSDDEQESESSFFGS